MSAVNLSNQEFEPENITAGSTSYFSMPDETLDPSIFDGNHLKSAVRHWILSTVHDFLRDEYIRPETWARLWIAGSGVSYQWSAARQPGDLDVMLGLNYIEFRHCNPEYSGLSDTEIAKMLNVDLFHHLYPEIDNVTFGASTFEVTVYVNAGVTAAVNGINFINPYAAYDLTDDEWAVTPNQSPYHRTHAAWELAIEADHTRGENIVRKYTDALAQIHAAKNDAHRRNGEVILNLALDAASGLFDEIHAGRRAAFGPTGHGYADYGNYRWQAGKANGVIPSMRRMHDYLASAKQSNELETYGLDLPDTETLIRRAGTYRSVR